MKVGLHLPLGDQVQPDPTRPSTIATALAADPGTASESADCEIEYGANSILTTAPRFTYFDPRKFEPLEEANARLRWFMTRWAVSAAEVALADGGTSVAEPRFMLACEVLAA